MNRMPNGAKYAISTGLAAAAVITAVSNADPAVASTTTPATEGDIVVLDSTWPNLFQAPARVGTVVAATSMELEGYDTTDTDDNPAGEGIGTFQKVTAFLPIDQVIGINQAGGEQNWETFQYAQDKNGKQRQSKTFKTPQTFGLTMHYDPNKPWYAKLKELDGLTDLAVVRETLPNGDVIYYAGQISFNSTPTKALNVSEAVVMTLALSAEPKLYQVA